MKKTIAVDFDGTISTYNGQEGVDYEPGKVGNPIPLMIERVKAWLAEGTEVVIFTARVHPSNPREEVESASKALKEFSLKFFGVELEVTHEKHPKFTEMWDDKAVRVIRETGVISDGSDVNDPLVKKDSDSIGSFFS